jgi:hypothetical protein
MNPRPQPNPGWNTTLFGKPAKQGIPCRVSWWIGPADLFYAVARVRAEEMQQVATKAERDGE